MKSKKNSISFDGNAFVVFWIVVGLLFAASILMPVNDILGEMACTGPLQDILCACIPFEVKSEGNLVVLRIDDIQAFAYYDVSKRMVLEAISRKMPLVLGVIPKNLEQDSRILALLKQNRCNTEIAMHGWDNSVNGDYALPEFGELSEEEALERILKGKAVLSKITSEPPVTFIPPNNDYSEGTKKALEKTGFKYISSEGDEYFDYGASTYNFDDLELNSVSKVISECEKAFEEEDPCTIMFHPQDYMTNDEYDPEKYQLYLDLLSELEKMNVSVVRFYDIPVPGK